MDDRMLRQAMLIPEKMKEATVVLVGLGMLGSWTAHSLARTVGKVIAYDFDTVGTENIGTQAYNIPDAHLSRSKADALINQLVGFPFEGVTQRFDSTERPEPLGPLIVVSAVDSFEGRRMIAEWAAEHADLFIDTRAHGTVGVVVTVLDIGVYLDTLENDADAPEPACGAEGCAFVGMWVAQMVTSSIRRWAARLPVPYKVVHDAGLAMDMLVEQVPPTLTPVGDGYVEPIDD